MQEPLGKTGQDYRGTEQAEMCKTRVQPAGSEDPQPSALEGKTKGFPMSSRWHRVRDPVVRSKGKLPGQPQISGPTLPRSDLGPGGKACLQSRCGWGCGQPAERSLCQIPRQKGERDTGTGRGEGAVGWNPSFRAYPHRHQVVPESRTVPRGPHCLRLCDLGSSWHGSSPAPKVSGGPGIQQGLGLRIQSFCPSLATSQV